jgi:hypothetical protein
LSPPLYRVTVTGDKGALTSVDFGSVAGRRSVARRDGQVLTVEREIVDDPSREAEPFRSAKLAFNRARSRPRGELTVRATRPAGRRADLAGGPCSLHLPTTCCRRCSI